MNNVIVQIVMVASEECGMMGLSLFQIEFVASSKLKWIGGKRIVFKRSSHGGFGR